MRRRDFLKATTLLLTADPRECVGKEPMVPDGDINGTLRKIAAVLRDSPNVQRVDEYLTENPSIGFTQWRWMHFMSNMPEEEIPMLEKANSVLLHSMERIIDLPDSHFDSLIQEGMVQGKVEQYLQLYRDALRKMITQQHTTVVPFGIGKDIPPSPEFVNREMMNADNFTKPTKQLVHHRGVCRGNLTLSPLARLGAGFILSQKRGIPLIAGEDPVIDEKAEEAQWHGNAETFEKYVMRERNAYFVERVRTSMQKMVNEIVGAAHDLRPAIRASNREHPEQISHLVVTTKYIPEEY